jgi:hypothetical protein
MYGIHNYEPDFRSIVCSLNRGAVGEVEWGVVITRKCGARDAGGNVWILGRP